MELKLLFSQEFIARKSVLRFLFLRSSYILFGLDFKNKLTIIITMTESQRLEIIRQMASNNNATQLSPALASFVDDLKADILAEELIVKHGLLESNERDVEDEVSHLASQDDRADEDDDFDNDENLHDMTAVSPTMRAIFED
jgi:hypothetical protein